MNKRDREELKWAIALFFMLLLQWLIYVLFIGWWKHFFCPHHWEGNILDFYNESELPHSLREAVLSSTLDANARVRYVTRANFFSPNDTIKVYSPKFNATYCEWRGEITQHG